VCNDYGNYVDYDDYLAAFSQTRIPVKWPDAIPNLPARVTTSGRPTRLPCHPPARRRDKRVCRATMGFSASPAETSAGHQFSV
jgi:hypothetical protein